MENIKSFAKVVFAFLMPLVTGILAAGAEDIAVLRPCVFVIAFAIGFAAELWLAAAVFEKEEKDEKHNL